MVTDAFARLRSGKGRGGVIEGRIQREHAGCGQDLRARGCRRRPPGHGATGTALPGRWADREVGSNIGVIMSRGMAAAQGAREPAVPLGHATASLLASFAGSQGFGFVGAGVPGWQRGGLGAVGTAMPGAVAAGGVAQGRGAGGWGGGGGGGAGAGGGGDQGQPHCTRCHARHRHDHRGSMKAAFLRACVWAG